MQLSRSWEVFKCWATQKSTKPEVSLPCSQEPATSFYPRWIQSISPNPTSIRSISLFIFQLRLVFLCVLFPFGIPIQSLYAFILNCTLHEFHFKIHSFWNNQLIARKYCTKYMSLYLIWKFQCSICCSIWRPISTSDWVCRVFCKRRRAFSPLSVDSDYAIMFVNKRGCPLHQMPLRLWLSEYTFTSCGD